MFFLECVETDNWPGEKSGHRAFKVGVRSVSTGTNIENGKLPKKNVHLKQVASFASIPAKQLKIITGGRVVRADESLASQGIKNSSTLMAVKVGIIDLLSLVLEPWY